MTRAGSQNDDAQQDVIQYSETAIRNNNSVLEYSRTCQAAASGLAAGVIGLSGFQGFIFYFVFALVQSIIWYFKSDMDVKTYFIDKTVIFSHSTVGGLFTYILFWVFLYGMVHVY